jgi:hypothetical protein
MSELDPAARRASAKGLAWLIAAVAFGACGWALHGTNPDLLPRLGWGLWGGLAAGTALAGLLRWRTPHGCDEAPVAVRKRYRRSMMVYMSAYVGLVMVSAGLMDATQPSWLRAVLALIPVPPIALAVGAMVRYTRQIDEMQRRIELESVCVASLLLAMLYMSGGFLQQAKVIDIPAAAAMIWVFPLLCALYGLAKSVVTARYH